MPAWTNVAKPTESSVLVVTTDVQPFGLLVAITSVLGEDTTSVTSGWTAIAKATSSVWTLVSKPTT